MILELYTVPNFGQENPRLIETITLFDQYSQYSKEANKICYSLSFIGHKQLIVDCQIETTPMIWENVFVIIQKDSYVSAAKTKYQTNINSDNSANQRKILVMDYSQNEQDSNDKTLIRGSLNQQIEIFGVDVDKQKDMLQIVENQEMDLLDFNIEREQLLILTSSTIEIINNTNFTTVHTINQTWCADAKSMISYQQLGKVDQKIITILIPCGNNILEIEHSPTFDIHSFIESEIQNVNKMSLTKDYIIEQNDTHATFRKQFIFISVGTYNVTGLLYPTGIADYVLELNTLSMAVTQIQNGLIEVKSENTGKAVVEFTTNNTCQRRYDFYVGPSNDKKLIANQEGVQIQRTLHKNGDLLEYQYDQLVIGADIHYEKEVRQQVNLSDFNISTNNVKILEIHEEVVFVEKQDKVYMVNLIYQRDDKELQTVKVRNSILISNDSNVSATRLFAYGNIMYFGYLVEKQLKLFLIEFKKFVKPIENQITTMNWDINLNLVIAYQDKVSDLNVYYIQKDNTLEKAYIITEEDFKDAFEIFYPTERCIALDDHNIWIAIEGKVYIYDNHGIIASYQDLHHSILKGCSFYKNRFLIFSELSQAMVVKSYYYIDQIYYLGDLSTFGFWYKQFKCTDSALYLWNEKQMYQYVFTDQDSLLTSLKNIIDITSIDSIPFKVNYLYDGILTDNLVQLLNSYRQITIQMDYKNPNDSDEMYHELIINLKFNNSFNSTLQVSLQEYILSVTGSIQPIQDAKMPTLKSQKGAYKFNPRELFNGPIYNISIENENYTVINQVHFNEAISAKEINDFAASEQYVYYLTRKGVFLGNQSYSISDCYKISIDQQSVYLFCNQNNYKSSLGELNFTQMELRFLRPFQMKIKNGNLYLRYFQELYGYSLETEKQIFNGTLKDMSIRDFDIADDGTIFLLEQQDGIVIMQTTKRFLYEQNEYNLSSILKNEILFDNTYFTSLKLTDEDTAIITTNNALNYEVDSDSVINIFSRLSTMPISSIEKSQDVVAFQYFDNTVSFHNKSESAPIISYFQVIEQVDGIEFINQTGLVVKQSNQLLIGEVSPYIEIDSNSTQTHIVKIQANGQNETKYQNLELMPGNGDYSAETKSQYYKRRMKELLNNPSVLATLVVIGAIILILTMVLIYRFFRRCCIMKNRPKVDDPQQFEGDYV